MNSEQSFKVGDKVVRIYPEGDATWFGRLITVPLGQVATVESVRSGMVYVKGYPAGLFFNRYRLAVEGVDYPAVKELKGNTFRSRLNERLKKVVTTEYVVVDQNGEIGEDRFPTREDARAVVRAAGVEVRLGQRGRPYLNLQVAKAVTTYTLV